MTRDQFGNLYAAGGFTDSTGKQYVAKYNGSSWSELGALNANSDINIILSDASGIFAAGFFTDSASDYYVAHYSFPTGINEITQTSSIKIFPNPANKIITIYSRENLSDATIQITDITGQILIEKTNQSGASFTLDISTQLSGMYFVSVNDRGNVWTGKVVKADN